MPKRKDENEIAFDALQQILRRDALRDGIPQENIPAPEKVPYRVEAGRKGGLKGGNARAEKLTMKQRKEISQKALKAKRSKLKKESHQN
jgi:hypothetical protein